jgi:hypothetical protein
MQLGVVVGHRSVCLASDSVGVLVSHEVVCFSVISMGLAAGHTELDSLENNDIKPIASQLSPGTHLTFHSPEPINIILAGLTRLTPPVISRWGHDDLHTEP